MLPADALCITVVPDPDVLSGVMPSVRPKIAPSGADDPKNQRLSCLVQHRRSEPFLSAVARASNPAVVRYACGGSRHDVGTPYQLKCVSETRRASSARRFRKRRTSWNTSKTVRNSALAFRRSPWTGACPKVPRAGPDSRLWKFVGSSDQSRRRSPTCGAHDEAYERARVVKIGPENRSYWQRRL